MIDLTTSEQNVLDELLKGDQNYALFRATKTGLSKSIFDATKEIRKFLRDNQLHDFDAQLQGQEHKKIVSGKFKTENGDIPFVMHLNRPQSGNGDPRFWIPEIREIAQPGYIFCLHLLDKTLTISKISASVGDSDEVIFPSTASDTKLEIMDKANQQDQQDLWSMLGNLWERATGGSDVAARPGDGSSSDWPSGPATAGVDSATKWFKTESKFPKFLFLVGGPGGGKSFTAAKLVEGLKEIDPQGKDLAYRAHRFETTAGQEIYLVNDATIGSDIFEENPLSQEIVDCLKNNSHLIACVNRGILVEESNLLNERYPLGQQLIQWVANGNVESAIDTSQTPQIQTTFPSDYLKAGLVLEGGKPVAAITAVYVDSCSLLEKVPYSEFISQEESSTFEGKPYVIQTFGARKTTPLDSIPAGVILKETIELLATAIRSESVDAQYNPFVANIQSLSNSQISTNLLSVARAAEIGSSTKFTYREIWGLICRSIVGNAPNIYNNDQIEKVISSHLPISEDPIENFNNFQTLAGFRYSQSIFGGGSEKSNNSLFDPVLRLMKVVDPVLDSQPGLFDGDVEHGWATPIVDAFSGPLTEGSPLESVLQQISQQDNFREVITPFDWALDKSFVEAMQSEKIKDSQRSSSIYWYSMYISRLYATSNGISAFAIEISNWLNLWKMSPHFPSDTVEKQFTTLIRPPRIPDDLNSSSLLPVFDSRTEPLRGDNARLKLAIRVNDVRFRTSRSGDSLFLHLEDHNFEVTKVLLDFALVREALSCVEGYPGVTELSKNVSPRLERVRAANLVPKMLIQTNEYRVVVDGKEETFSLERSSN